MNTNKFHRILRKYRLGDASEAEKALVDQWYDLLDDGENSTEPDWEQLEKRLWLQLTKQVKFNGKTGQIVTRPRITSVFSWKVAVAALVTGIVFWAGFRFNQSTTLVPAAIVALPVDNVYTQINTSTLPLKFILEDSSIVILASGTKITYPQKFALNRREVYLEGEAFFEISKNPNRPFYVYSGSVVTRVLGTSFRIKPLQANNKLEVSVRTGKVEVYEYSGTFQNKMITKNTGVVLTPNQKVVYTINSRVFESSVVDLPLPVIASDAPFYKSPQFVFEETPFFEVLKLIEEAYGIKIIVEKESLNNCTFTGDISQQNLFEKLSIINQVLNTKYEIKGTTILIKGEGCQ